MKKGFLVMIVMLCMMIVGCGKGTGTKTTEDEEIKANQVQKINLNEAIDCTDVNYQFTVTEIGDFEINYMMNKGRYEGLESDGYSFVKVSYKIKNIGKQNWGLLGAVIMDMNYADGYTFMAERYWYYDPDVYTDTSLTKKGAWLNQPPSLGPFDDAVDCVAVFKLPDEVKNSTEPWSLIVSVGGNEYEYVLRE